MYEHRRATPVSTTRFMRRLGNHFLGVAALVGLSLIGGMQGYEHYEHLPWRDAFLNSAMLLGGMGPVNTPATPGGKIFAGLYALFAGLVFLVVAGVMLAPVIHRIAHRLHWEEGAQAQL
jgi:hypothetical protein